MNRVVSALAALILTAGTVAVATPALAASSESRSVVISTTGLDLGTPKHRARLEARVGRAAHKVCGGNDNRGLFAYRSYRECRDAAIRNALGA